MSLRFIDLFCGIGGFRAALEDQGLKCVFSSDINKPAGLAYHANFGELPAGDITKIASKDIPTHDILCAGFPCQPFSISGKRKALDDVRGTLFYEIARIARHHKPKALLLENVKNILTISNGAVISLIEKTLAEIGYALQYDLLNCSNFGIPQARERVYFVAIRNDLTHKISYTAPVETNAPVELASVLENDVDPKMLIKRDDIRLLKDDAQTIPKNKPIRLGILNKGGQGERIYSTKGHAVTLSAYGGGVGAKTGLYLTPQGIRRLTPLECKRVMGFPDTHIVSEGGQAYRQLGNAISPPMVELVYKNIKGL